MQDTSIKGNGTSRFIKGASNFPTSFEEFRRQIMAGTLTADIGLNPAGCDVVGTALSKANLLTEETSQKIGLMTVDKTVNEAIAKLFTFADDGKKACASAVSAMGVSTESTASFNTIAENIRKIKTGSDVSGVTATASDVRSNKYFVTSSGIKTKGKLVSRDAVDIVTQMGSSHVVIPEGIYDKSQTVKVTDDNIIDRNILKNVKILGQIGSLIPSKTVTYDQVSKRNGNLDVFNNEIILNPYTHPYNHKNLDLQYVVIDIVEFDIPSSGSNLLSYIDCGNIHRTVYGNSSNVSIAQEDGVIESKNWRYDPLTDKLHIIIPTTFRFPMDATYNVSCGYEYYGDPK